MAFFNIDKDMVEQAEEINASEAKSFITPSGLYPVRINVAFLTESATSEAAGLTIEYTAEGWKFPKRETLWFQGRDGGTTRMAKKRDGSEYPDETFGMKQVRGICKVTDVDIETLEKEPGMIETKDGTKEVQVFSAFTGKIFVAGLQAVLEDKYSEPTEEVSSVNMIWVGKTETDAEGVVFPWGRSQSAEKFQAVIDKEPVKDERELSKPGASAEHEAGSDEAASAFGGFGGQ